MNAVVTRTSWVGGAGLPPDLELHHIVVNQWEPAVDSEQNVVLISIPSVKDPGLAPAGKHTLHAYLPATEPFSVWEGALPTPIALMCLPLLCAKHGICSCSCVPATCKLAGMLWILNERGLLISVPLMAMGQRPVRAEPRRPAPAHIGNVL